MMFFKRKPAQRALGSEPQLRCSFCNKADSDVKKLIAGPAVFICDECIQVCNDILRDDRRSVLGEAPPTEAPPAAPVPTSTLVLRCALCDLPVVSEEMLPIGERGFLCPGCTRAIEAALAEGQEPT